MGSNPAPSPAPPPATYDSKGMELSAQLLNAGDEAGKRSADVKVTVSGVRLVDPDEAHEQARQGEGHLAYRIDDGPVIVTTATKLEFHELPHGTHRIVVELAANDGTPLGPHDVLWVTIP